MNNFAPLSSRICLNNLYSENSVLKNKEFVERESSNPSSCRRASKAFITKGFRNVEKLTSFCVF